jgi:predicted anti-sigma-YlaC factor YlaD
MDCKSIEQLLYLYTELAPDEKEQVKEHLESCTACRQLLESIQQTQQKIHTVAVHRAVPAHAANLTRRIVEKLPSRSKTSPAEAILQFMNKEILRYSLSTVSFILVVVFMIQFFDPGQPNIPTRSATSKVVVLNASQWRSAFSKKQQSRSAVAQCISPFRSDAYIKECLMNTLK